MLEANNRRVLCAALDYGEALQHAADAARAAYNALKSYGGIVGTDLRGASLSALLHEEPAKIEAIRLRVMQEICGEAARLDIIPRKQPHEVESARELRHLLGCE